MTSHLESKHSLASPVKKRKNSNSENISKDQQDLVDLHLARFISSSHSSLNLVEDENFHEFVKSLCSVYKLPSRQTLRDLILKEAADIKEKMITQTNKVPNLSYCMDLWKSKSMDYYVAVTVHFIDDKWKLCDLPIAFRRIEGPHTAQAVGHLVADLLQPFLGDGLYPFSGVIDGGDIASVKFTSEKLRYDIKDQTCICHQLNNIIKRMLNDYFSGSYLAEWRIFVKRIRKSNPFREMWKQCCLQFYDSEITLQIDTPTRWSSTVAMLSKAVVVKSAVERMYNITLVKDKQDHHEFVPNWDHQESEKWKFLEKIVELFQPTIEAISSLQGQYYVTQSLILLQICHIQKRITLMQEKYPRNENAQLHVVMNDLKESVDLLWDKLPIDTVISTILDPRTKFYDKIPEIEINEALEILKTEYIEIIKANPHQMQKEQIQRLSGLFDDLIEESFGHLSPVQTWNKEIAAYKIETRASPNSDPLVWWKVYENQFPILSKLAKNYLAIPASQASCERLFSVAKDDICEKRTLLLPDLVEALLFISQRKEVF